MIRRACLSILILCLLLPPAKVHAEIHGQEADWGELRTKYFSIIYPTEYADMAQAMYTVYQSQLDMEYERFAALFNTQLSIPITLRIYPTLYDYRTLNALAPEVNEDATHSHIGSREIALIGENIASNFELWIAEGMNAFRSELAILFAVQISDQKAPPGLLAGIGGYAQNPVDILTLYPELLQQKSTSRPWRELWEDDSIQISRQLIFEATSITAYLVDTYGWGELITYLRRLASAEGYRSALSEEYKKTFDILQEDWRCYYPRYVEERWQMNVLYNYDLSRDEALITAGGYTEAAQNLISVSAFLKILDQSDQSAQVSTLLNTAIAGQEANRLTALARQAFNTGNYSDVLELTAQAQEQFGVIGDTRRQAELETYRSRAETILKLRNEAEALATTEANPFTAAESSARLLEISAELTRLGDSGGAQAAQSSVAHTVYLQNLVRAVAAGIAVFFSLLVLLWITWLTRRRRSEEARL